MKTIFHIHTFLRTISLLTILCFLFPTPNLADEWEKQSLPIPAGETYSIRDIWGSSENNIFAVGDNETQFILLHYNGQEWTLITTGDGTNTRIWGNSTIDVYFSVMDTIYHFDGNNWDEMADIPQGTIGFDALWGSSRILYTNYSSSLYRYNGVWIEMSLEDPEQNFYPKGIWGTDWDNVFSVGVFGDIYHYDGNESYIWTEMFSPLGDGQLNSVWGTSGNNIYAAGYVELPNINIEGVILKYNGTNWHEENNLTHIDLRNSPLEKLHGSSDTNIFVVGGNGLIIRYNGSAWEDMDSGVGSTLLSLWVISEDVVFVGGANNTILRYVKNIEVPAETDNGENEAETEEEDSDGKGSGDCFISYVSSLQ